jgi:sulfonate transport system substrate-binding protein
MRETPTRYDFNVRRYAETYAQMGLSELGALLSCKRDGAFCEGYDARLKLTRTQTIMQGADHCDFRYTLDGLKRMTMPLTRRNLLKTTLAAAFAAPALRARAAAPATISIDYAYYNPFSLLLRTSGWLEEEFKRDRIAVNWVLSLGSNKALEYLRGGSLDFGSTAGSAVALARANGLAAKAVYVYSKPEWTTLVTRADSGIAKIQDLKGKRVAVTRGTDPHIFLLRALDSEGLSESDIETVLLQHPDGYQALVSKQVDAWAGLDPHMARAELESGAKLFYRNTAFNSYGLLNTREAFAKDYPEIVRRVLAVYEKARLRAVAHSDELQADLVEAASVSATVAHKQLSERTDLSQPNLGDEHRATLVASLTVLKKIGLAPAGADPQAVVDALIDPSFAPKRAG